MELSEEIKFEPALIRLALPETESEANKDLELLQSFRPLVWEDIDGIPREILNEHVEKMLNWIRAWVKIQKDKQAAHTAA